MTALLHSLFAAGAVLALPAAASAAETPGAARTHGAIERIEGTASMRGNTRIVCIRTPFTGSRIDRRICRTEQEWRDSGARVEPANRF